ncbi:hypothetical protein QBC47DRAFT_185741 [Echria macrotheca]|uniref:Uncharacterized protein n=1 Tax=Echria macrotheca TaxID=438768 RepID=A0AAJ0BEA6_9PEZI|nr:hypothetical protein QBC47DRAFT_185741 [Echria macrotheca]
MTLGIDVLCVLYVVFGVIGFETVDWRGPWRIKSKLVRFGRLSDRHRSRKAVYLPDPRSKRFFSASSFIKGWHEPAKAVLCEVGVRRNEEKDRARRRPWSNPKRPNMYSPPGQRSHAPPLNHSR